MVAASVAVASGDLPQTAVLVTPSQEEGAAASGNYLVWDQAAQLGSDTLVYVRHGGTTRMVNAAGTQGYSGGIDGTRIVYMQLEHGQSNLMLYNAASHVRSDLPAGFNTSQWEYRPSISGQWILFGRDSLPNHRHQDVILRNRITGQQVILASVNSTQNRVAVVPGQVNGNWAVWYRCTELRCSIYRRDIAAGITKKLINTFATGRYEFAPSVAKDGTAYFMHESQGCGHNAILAKHPVGQAATTLVHFKPGYDVLDTSATANPTSGTDVYFTKYRCARYTTNVFKVTAP